MMVQQAAKAEYFVVDIFGDVGNRCDGWLCSMACPTDLVGFWVKNDFCSPWKRNVRAKRERSTQRDACNEALNAESCF